MSLTDLNFLGVFLPILLILYYNPVIKNNSFRKIILFCAGLGLYSLGEPLYFFLLFGVISCNYLLVKIAEKTNKDILRAGAIIFDVLILLFFKYINYLLHLGLVHKISAVIFPIGLSYYIFKTISYVVDSKKVKKGSFIDVTIYVSNFFTIVSGPLSTYEDEISAIHNKVKIDGNAVYKGVERFVIGLAKKIIIADSLSVLVIRCFETSELTTVMAWVGAIAYALQLYFDFSGYTDIVLGLGSLFGFAFPENFNYPYMAKSVSDFWKRWHMSLTKWFTKYIYIPLGGSRVKTVVRHIFNLFVVWLVTGIWHGSSLTFLLWAMIYFVLQAIEKYTKLATALNKVHLGHVYAILVIIIEWVIFKSESISSAVSYIKGMLGLNGNGFICNADFKVIVQYIIPLIVGLVFSTNVGKIARKYCDRNAFVKGLYNFGLLVIFIICIIITISQGYSAPLYAGF